MELSPAPPQAVLSRIFVSTNGVPQPLCFPLRALHVLGIIPHKNYNSFKWKLNYKLLWCVNQGWFMISVDFQNFNVVFWYCCCAKSTTAVVEKQNMSNDCSVGRKQKMLYFLMLYFLISCGICMNLKWIILNSTAILRRHVQSFPLYSNRVFQLIPAVFGDLFAL